MERRPSPVWHTGTVPLPPNARNLIPATPLPFHSRRPRRRPVSSAPRSDPMAYAARLVAKVHLAATPRAEPRHLSSFRVGKRVGALAVCCIYCFVVPRRWVSWLRSLDRDKSEIDLGEATSLRCERRPSAKRRVKLVGCPFPSHLPPSVTSLFFSFI